MSDSDNVFLAAISQGDEPPDISQIGRTPKKDLPPELLTSAGVRDHMVDYVRKFWADPSNDKDTSFTPMVLAVCENGDIVPMMVALDFSEEEKEKFAIHCQMLFKIWNVQRYAFVSEAWAASYTPDIDRSKPHLMPSEMEDRKEIVMILVNSRDDDQEFIAYELVRDWTTGKVTELAPYLMPEGMTTGGRFSRLLKDPPENPAHNEENIKNLAMLKVLCNPPEMMRARYEAFDQDFDAAKLEGETIWQRLETAFSEMAQTPVYALNDDIVDRVNTAMNDARLFAGRLVADIQERQARERPN